MDFLQNYFRPRTIILWGYSGFAAWLLETAARTVSFAPFLQRSVIRINAALELILCIKLQVLVFSLEWAMTQHTDSVLSSCRRESQEREL